MGNRVVKIYGSAKSLLKALSTKLLKDRAVVGFRLRIKLEFEGGGKPFDYSMKGARENGNEWMLAPLSPVKAPDPMTEEEIREGLQSIIRFVEDYVLQHSLEERWSKLLVKFEPIFKKWGSVENCLQRSDLEVHAMVSHGYNGALLAPMVARQYALEATEALDNKDLAVASDLLIKGAKWLNPKFIINDPSKLYFDRAKKGGEGREKLYAGPMKSLAETYLLSQSATEWESVQAAVKATAEHIQNEHKDELLASPLLFETLEVNLTNWFRKYPDRFKIRIKS